MVSFVSNSTIVMFLLVNQKDLKLFSHHFCMGWHHHHMLRHHPPNNLNHHIDHHHHCGHHQHRHQHCHHPPPPGTGQLTMPFTLQSWTWPTSFFLTGTVEPSRCLWRSTMLPKWITHSLGVVKGCMSDFQFWHSQIESSIFWHSQKESSVFWLSQKETLLFFAHSQMES